MADKDQQGKYQPQQQTFQATNLEQQQQATQGSFEFMGEDVGYGQEGEHGQEVRASARVNPDHREFLPGFRHGQST